jgi:hypothetical protein
VGKLRHPQPVVTLSKKNADNRARTSDFKDMTSCTRIQRAHVHKGDGAMTVEPTCLQCGEESACAIVITALVVPSAVCRPGHDVGSKLQRRSLPFERCIFEKYVRKVSARSPSHLIESQSASCAALCSLAVAL